MVSKIRRWGRIGALAALFASTSALADYELYKDGDTTLNLQFTTIGAQFGQDQSWFGVEKNFAGVTGKHWTEFGTEFGAKGEMGLWGGTFFGEASGIYTRSSGDDASGVAVGDGDLPPAPGSIGCGLALAAY